MSLYKRALIIGGSMSGLFTGLLLRRAGWDVKVFERVQGDLAGRGAGLVTHREIEEALVLAGIDTPLAHLGVEILRRQTLDRDGRVIAERECRQRTTSWDRLYRLLRAAFPAENYFQDKELVGIDDNGQRVTATFADGSRADGDLLVGADGFRSTVRTLVLPEAQPTYVGYVAWRGLVHENELSPRTLRELFPYYSFCLPPGEQMLGYPVAGPENDLRSGRRRYNFVWYRSADEHQLADLLTDASGRTHVMSIPPPLVRRDIVAEMRTHAEEVLAPQFAEVVNLTPLPFLQPIYDFKTPHMVVGRVVIIGDAAFVVRPHVTAGVTKAAEDAMALAHALKSEADIDVALAGFERLRMEANRRIVDWGRAIGTHLQPRLDTEEERILAARHGTTEAVMAEVAVLDFIRTPAESSPSIGDVPQRPSRRLAFPPTMASNVDRSKALTEATWPIGSNSAMSKG
jgi:2-polyprenyl-6-methoxyphenol hydroxylase-like FAD-dependent oxidoreductase